MFVRVRFRSKHAGRCRNHVFTQCFYPPVGLGPTVRRSNIVSSVRHQAVWLAGGGVKPGISYGKTDDYCYNIVENGVSVHDLHATIMHLMGIDHDRLTYRYQGRDFRLTDVHGNVINELLV